MKYIKTEDIKNNDVLINVFAFGGLIVFFLVLRNIGSIFAQINWLIKILMPLFIAFAIYFLLLPLKNIFIKYLPKKLPKKSTNLISTLLTLAVVICFVFLFFFLFVPQLISSIEVLVVQMPNYFTQIVNWISGYVDSSDMITRINELVNNVIPYINSILESVKDFLIQFLSGSLPFLISLLTCISFLIVLLNDHTQLRIESRKFLYFAFPKKAAQTLLATVGDISIIFRKYFIGQLTDAALVGIVTLIVMLVLKLPYPVLIAFIIAVTNIIPFFGPFIGAIPCGILILMVNPFQALIFAIMILVIQQIDGNIIAPMIVGDSLSIPPIYILFSITVGGSLFGILGMLIGVPVFSVLMMLFKRFIMFIEEIRKKDESDSAI